MRNQFTPLLCLAALMCAGAAELVAQAMPTTQPSMIQIYRETIKPGMSAAHEANESGWPRAFAQAGSQDWYLAMESMTGQDEVWFIQPFASYTAMGKMMESNAANAGLSAELGRLGTADGAYLSEVSVIEAMAVPALSYGAFPDLNKQRFWEISVWRIRPGHDADFFAATAAYKKIVDKAAPQMSWRTYRVTAGMPAGTYLIFSSVTAFSQFDQMMEQGQAVDKAITPQDQAMFRKFFSEGMAFGISNRYRLSPTMSFVSPETKAADPGFWNK